MSYSLPSLPDGSEALLAVVGRIDRPNDDPHGLRLLLVPDDQQLVILAGAVSPRAGEPEVQVIQVPVGHPAEGTVRVRAVHAATAPALDVASEGTGGVLTPILDKGTLGASTPSPGVLVSGFVNIELIKAGVVVDTVQGSTAPPGGDGLFDEARLYVVAVRSVDPALATDHPLELVTINASFFVWFGTSL